MDNWPWRLLRPLLALILSLSVPVLGGEPPADPQPYFLPKLDAGIKLIRQKHYEEARELLKELYNHAAENRKVAYLYALALFKTGRWREAEPIFKGLADGGGENDPDNLVSLYLREIAQKRVEAGRDLVMGGRNIDQMILGSTHGDIPELKKNFHAALEEGRPFIALRFFARLLSLDRAILGEPTGLFDDFVVKVVERFKGEKGLPLHKKFLLALAYRALDQDNHAENILLSLEREAQFTRWAPLIELEMAAIQEKSATHLEERRMERANGTIFPGVAAFGVHLGDTFTAVAGVWGPPARIHEHWDGREAVYQIKNEVLQKEEEVLVLFFDDRLRVRRIEVLACEHPDFQHTSLAGVRFWESPGEVLTRLEDFEFIKQEKNRLEVPGLKLFFQRDRLTSLTVSAKK